MKRLLIFTLLILLCTAACVPSGGPEHTPALTLQPSAPNEPGMTYHDVCDPETDFDNRFVQMYEGFAENDEAYYWLPAESGFVYCIEKNGGEYAPLCGKPECMHELGGDSAGCNANTHKYLPGLSMYDGKLYFVSSDRSDPRYVCALYSMEPDGTGRERVFCLDNSVHALQRFWIHRGMMFAAAYTNTVIDGAPSVSICFLCGSLDGSGIEPVLERLYPADECGWPTFFMRFYGDTAFFGISACDPNDGTALNEIYEYALDTGSVTERFCASGCDFQMCGICMADNGQLYISSFAYCWDRHTTPAVYLLKEGRLEIAFDFEDDVEYGRVLLFDGIAVGVSSDTSVNGADTVWIRRLNGDTIVKGALTRSFLDGYNSLKYGGCELSADEAHVYCFFSGWVKDDPLSSFFVRYDITDGCISEALSAFAAG